MKVGFIGLGVMGNSMAKNLLNNGYDLNVFTRTKQKANEVLTLGAKWYDKIADLASESDVIITIVGYPKDVEDIYLGSDGIIQHAKPGSYCIDMTTSSPILARKIYQAAKEKGVQAIDAPVSGGDIGAKAGKLTIMVGGEQDAFTNIKPILAAIGTNVILQGEAGSGQHTKMSNQIIIASTMIGITESLIYAEKAGLHPSRVLDSIGSGAASSWSLSNLVPRMINEDFSPGFYVKHFIKDMKIALESARELGLHTPGLALALKLYEELAAMGEENSGTQALYKLLIAKAENE